MLFEQAVSVFFKKFNPHGDGSKLALLITGGGFSCLDFMTMPGSSRILEMATMPYSNEMLIHMLEDTLEYDVDHAHFKSCYENTAALYVLALEKIAHPLKKPIINNNQQLSCIAVTAALRGMASAAGGRGGTWQRPWGWAGEAVTDECGCPPQGADGSRPEHLRREGCSH